jgi:Tol biopolymer transport system component
MKASRALILIVAAVELAVCTSAPPPPPATQGVGLKATFVLANPAGLLALDDAGRALGRIVDLPPQSAPATPVLHPTGKAVVFALTQQPDKKTGFGSDLYSVNLDGTAFRPVVQHEGDNVFYASPRFDSTGNVLYFHRRAAIIQAGSFLGNEDSIERLDLRTGERKRILMNGADPALSPDGKLIVYVHLTQGQPDGLWTASIDGSNARPFFKTKDTWWYLQAPRFSPNGCEIVFSAAGHTLAGGYAPRPPVAQANGRSVGGARLSQGLLHLNIPSELYVAPCDGTSVRTIGQTGDDVVPAWSPDATRVAYVGTGAFFILTLATGNVRTIAQGQDFFFGDLVWIK